MTTDQIVETGLRVDGWSTKEKLTKMVELILERKPKVLVEVGIYGGRSFFPMYWASKQYPGSALYGCDPYSPHASASGSGRNYDDVKWWEKLDHEWIYNAFIQNFNMLPEPPTFQRKKGLDFDIRTIDFLHLDDNHAADESMAGVKYWLARMNPGSIFVMDDCDWESLQGTVKYLDDNLKLLDTITTTNIVKIYETPKASS